MGMAVRLERMPGAACASAGIGGEAGPVERPARRIPVASGTLRSQGMPRRRHAIRKALGELIEFPARMFGSMISVAMRGPDEMRLREPRDEHVCFHVTATGIQVAPMIGTGMGAPHVSHEGL
jgi:hypothetical protein